MASMHQNYYVWVYIYMSDMRQSLCSHELWMQHVYSPARLSYCIRHTKIPAKILTLYKDHSLCSKDRPANISKCKRGIS